MREILFRGKPICPTGNIAGLKRDGFVYGYFVKLRLKSTGKVQYLIQPVDKRGHAMLLVEVDPETVGQYTGMKDKLGKKIFEGDIFDVLKCARCYVEWNQESMQFCVVTVGKDIVNEMSICVPDTIEVIGNIYDNPELIGGEQREAD